MFKNFVLYIMLTNFVQSHMIFKMGDGPKYFLALLNGLARRNYYGHSELTDDVLKEEIYPDISQEEFARISSRAAGLMKVLSMC